MTFLILMGVIIGIQVLMFILFGHMQYGDRLPILGKVDNE